MMRPILRWLSLILLPLAGAGLLGCPGSAKAADVGPPVMGNQDFIIPDSDLPRLQSEALAGSGEAAYRLNLFYDFIKLDFREGLYWITIAAENGYPKAFYALGFLLLIPPDSDERIRQRNVERAKFWLKRAADGGEPLAVQRLKEIEQGKYK